VLRKRATDACGVLRPQCNTSPTLVLEVIHLFGDDICGITESQKYSEVFKHRGNNAFVSGRLDNVCELARKGTPATRLRGKDVSGTRTGLE
jgi:hypothetical protein